MRRAGQLLLALVVAGGRGARPGWRRTRLTACSTICSTRRRPASACWRQKASRAAVHIYPLRLVSRLERRFEEDREHPAPLRWFTDGRLVTVPEAKAARCCCSAPTRSAATSSRGCCTARAPRWRWPWSSTVLALADRRADRRRRRLRRRNGGRPAVALHRLRAGAAGDLRRAGAARGDAAGAAGRPRCSCCSAASSRCSAGRSSPAACARSSRPSASATTRSPATRSARAPSRILLRHLLPAARGYLGVAGDAAAAGVHPGGSDALVRRPRLSRHGADVGHDAAGRGERVAARRRAVDAGAGRGDLRRRPRREPRGAGNRPRACTIGAMTAPDVSRGSSLRSSRRSCADGTIDEEGVRGNVARWMTHAAHRARRPRLERRSAAARRRRSGRDDRHRPRGGAAASGR